MKSIFLKHGLEVSVNRLLRLIHILASCLGEARLEAVNDVAVQVLQPDGLGPLPAPALLPVPVRHLHLPQLPLYHPLDILVIPPDAIIPPGVVISMNEKWSS